MSRTCSYYHSTATMLPVGEVVVAHPARRDHPSELLIERYRPRSAPTRLGAFFLTDDPVHNEVLGGFNTRYYQVEPVGPTVRADYFWLYEAKELLESGVSPKDPELIACIRNYWSGKRHRSHRAWEWVAERIYVCRLLSARERQAAMRAGERKYGFDVISERLIRDALADSPDFERLKRALQTGSALPSAPRATVVVPSKRTLARAERAIVRMREDKPRRTKVQKKRSTCDEDFERELRRIQGLEKPRRKP